MPFVHEFAHHALDPALRHIYTGIAIQFSQGQSHDQLKYNLEHAIGIMEIKTQQRVEGQAKTARTATAALGADPDRYIKEYVVCPNHDCWNFTPRSELGDLETNKCQVQRSGRTCNEVLFVRHDQVRKPIKTIAYQLLSTYLGLLFQNSDTVEHLRHWRQADDAQPHGLLSRDNPFLDKTEQLHGLSQGSAWRSYGSNAMRWVGADGHVQERSDGARHVDEEFGLQIVLNCDW